MSVENTARKLAHLKMGAERYGRYTKDRLAQRNGEMDNAEITRFARNAGYFAIRYLRSKRAQDAAFARSEKRFYEASFRSCVACLPVCRCRTMLKQCGPACKECQFDCPCRTANPMGVSRVYQPKTGERCGCKRGVERDNCPACEGTGQRIDFRAIRAYQK